MKMRKKNRSRLFVTLLAGASAVFATSAFAAFDVTGNYTVSSKVGIGTQSPQASADAGLDIRALNNPSIILGNTGVSSYTLMYDDDAANFRFLKTNTSGAAIINMDPIVQNGTSQADVRYFRSTNTSGNKAVYFYKGDGSATIDARVGVGGTDTYFNSGNVGIGVTAPTAKLQVSTNLKTGTDIYAGTQVSCAVLEIRGEGNDLAEGFKVNSASAIEPGMVVAIDTANPGELVLSDQPYQMTVAGIISGAGDKRVGLQLGHADEVRRGELHPVALTGRVWCWVDASYGAVQPGSLLTTSPTEGHAMAATDHAKAQGAVLGKAMTPLAAGKGLVLVLVSLQ